ncbi:AAA family ATPase [Mesorhizobium sp. M0030]|uniref:AAA family ATPase n=1 Tax=Mesorhizobium sp. M0030 TaxID=2956851 RepID=UPI00333524F8
MSYIAQAFLQLERSISSQRSVPRDFPLNTLEYDMGGQSYKITKESGNDVSFMVGGRPSTIAELALPSRVIAMTITPHDRFPLNQLSHPSRPQPTELVYKYLGLRDRSGRASMLSFLYNALENLLQRQGGSDRRDRIVGVFNLLDYRPRIDITYSLRMSRASVEMALKSPDLPPNLSPYQERRVSEIVESEGYDAFRASLALAISMEEKRLIEVSADLSMEQPANSVVTQLQTLRRAGYLSIRSIKIEKKSGEMVDLKEASSGELSIASSLIGLAGVLEDNCLVLIDEPEISLHPEWQSSYVEMLLNTFRAYKGVHYLIATHSPLVVSDAPVQALVKSLDRGLTFSGGDVAGRSVDRLLARLFKLPTANNLYLRDEIVSALRMAADGKVGSAEFATVVDGLSDMAENIDKHEPVTEVIAALVSARTGVIK